MRSNCRRPAGVALEEENENPGERFEMNLSVPLICYVLGGLSSWITRMILWAANEDEYCKSVIILLFGG